MIRFKNREQIQNLIEQTDDIQETKRLISKFKKLQEIRKPFFLTKEDFEEILEWKLGGQYWRSEKIRKKNTGELIELITKTAFEITHEDKDFETELRINTLTLLKGVGIPVASSILALCVPEKYAVIDYRNWEQLFGERKTSYTIKNYLDYLKEIKKLSEKFGFTCQEIDSAIWQSYKS